MPNDIEVMAKQRTTSVRKRRVKIAGFLRVARWRMVPVPLGTLSHGPRLWATSVLGFIDARCEFGL